MASYDGGKKCDRFGNPFGFLAIIKFVINLSARYVTMHVKINIKLVEFKSFTGSAEV